LTSLLLPALALLATATPAVAYECPDYASEVDRLRELETNARKGALNEDEKACLEKAYASADASQTGKNKISRVLLVNAYAYSTKYWAELMERHLDEVDRSDPDLAYLWAFYKFNTEGPASAEEVVKWTETALERKDVWTGDVFVSRVYGLMKLRAVAASAQWKSAEEQRIKGSSNDGIEELRNIAKVYAREWVDFAGVSGRDTEESLQVCLAAATNAKACGVEEE